MGFSQMLAFLAALLLQNVLGDYCSCGPTIEQDSNLGATSLVGVTENFDETSDCPGTKGPRDFTNLVANVYRGKKYSLFYNVTKCGTMQYQTLSGAWIDWNQDKRFDPNTEKLFAYSRSFGPQSHDFTVPSDAKMGTTRLRVQVQETSAASLDPCQNFAYGGAKDFGIEVTAPASSGISGGTVFLILVIVFSSVYVVAGCVYTRAKLGATGCTRETCWHHEFWFAIPGLIMDGCRYTKAKITGQRGDGDYATMDGGDL